MFTYCPECLKKQQRINELEEEIVRLKARLRYQERTVEEGFFGSSTPSSKLPVKPNTLSERRARCGGAKPGHPGHGRASFSTTEAHHTQPVELPDQCPFCGATLQPKEFLDRSVLDAKPLEIHKVVYRLERKRCPRCHRALRARAPKVLPKALLSNRLLAHMAVEHYLRGITLGHLQEQTGIGSGTLVQAFHQLAQRLNTVPERLVEEYRQALVKHADETGWSNDGQNGHAWLFATLWTSIFRFRHTRSASVPKELFGEYPLPGTLVVDRYAAYNKAPCYIQYCYCHLSRDVQDIQKQFPNEPEVHRFVDTLVPLLTDAIQLRSLPISNKQFLRRAASLKQNILSVVHRDARHPAVQTLQNIFRANPHRLYHWARDRTIPADNNLAERDFRPLVIARKISFGSQSERGARTREILMTVLHTLKKRLHGPSADVHDALCLALDRIAEDPSLDPFRLLFPTNPITSYPQTPS